jgi:hypothetical protein
MKLKLRMILDVEFETNGEPDLRQLECNLDWIAAHASLHGLMSEDTKAEVKQWQVKVERLS